MITYYLDGYVDPIKQMLLNWETRYKIIVGIARRLLYLHEDSQLKIIHCDLKAGNVLLDGAMNPKIADFGMARLFINDQSRAKQKECGNLVSKNFIFLLIHKLYILLHVS